MKYSQKLFIGGLSAAFLIGGVVTFQFLEKEKDPLQELLGDIFIEKNIHLEADFLTDSLYSYTGPKSSEIQSCIANRPQTASRGILYATIDTQELTTFLQEKADGTFNRIEVRNQILPVLGYAMQNSQINWDWKPDTASYEFYMEDGEEPFWDCYFDLTSSTEFFPRFFAETHYDITDISSQSTISISEDSGSSNIDGVTNDNTLIISGVAEKNALITLYLDGVVIGTAQSDANGNYSFDYTGTVLADKSYNIQTTATIGSNISEKSNIFVVVVNTQIQNPTVNTPTGGKPVVGTAEPESIVIVSTPSGSTCTVEVNASGYWSCSLSPDPINGESITIQSTDLAGNISSITKENAIENDITSPPVPNGPADLIDASDSGTDNKDNITNNTTPIFETYCSENGSTISLYADGQKIGTAFCTLATDTPEITLTTPLSEGTHQIEYTETDGTGNESGKSPVLEIIIDTISPTEIPELTSPNAPTSNLNIPLVGSCGSDAANGVIELTSNPANGFTPYPATSMLDPIGNFNIAVTWEEGTYDIILKCYDKAGNGPKETIVGPVILSSCPANNYEEATYDSCNVYH